MENIDAAELEPGVEEGKTSVKEDAPAELQAENAGYSTKSAAPYNVRVAPLATVGTRLPAAFGPRGSNNSFNSNNNSHSNDPSKSTGFYNHFPKTMMECTAMIQQASNSIRASNSSRSAKDAEIDKLKKALNDWKNNVKAIKVQDLRAGLTK
jgi:hypothetical protein